MIPVLEGEIPVVVWAGEVRQIQAAVAWAEQENIRIIIGGGYDAWRVADLLKKNDIPVLAGGIHRLPARRFEEYDDPYRLPSQTVTRPEYALGSSPPAVRPTSAISPSRRERPRHTAFRRTSH